MHPKLKQTESYTIRTYEIDSRKKATIPALINLMHETAMQNVINLKLSVWDLEKHQISWVLMRFLFNVKRVPKLGEEIKVLTHPAGFEKFYTYRDYRIFDQNDELIASASSTWLLMDTVKRRVTRIPAFLLEMEMPDIKTCLPRPSNKLTPFGTAYRQKEFQVNWFDLDFNEHLNNVPYGKWMLESMDPNLLRNGQLTQFDMLFRAEGRWEDEIISEVAQIDELTFQHRLIRKADQKELAQAQSQWVLEKDEPS